MNHLYTQYSHLKIQNQSLWLCIFALAFLLSLPTNAQTFRFQLDASVPVLVSSDTIPNAWAGGLNAAQYSTIRLNNDAIDDLVVFDRATNKISTFLAEKNGNSYHWKHSSFYETLFPSVSNWMLLVDYDYDGKKDIFTYTSFGVRVFRNTSTNGNLSWELASELLLSESSSGEFNLSVLPSDIPAILDVDNDGDVDILSGDAIGHVLYWYQNQSMERNGSPNQLKFKTISRCWGAFSTNEFCGQFGLNIQCLEDVSGRTDNSGRVEHAGSAALALDMNNDGLKEVLFSGVSCTSIGQLTNGGTLTKARMSSFISEFPAEKPIDLLFPAAFYEDIDFDGIKDLISAPNVSANEGGLLDFRNSNWLYKNTGTTTQPVFSFVEENFLQKTMIDRGDMTSPALADYDGDGDLDLFIGNAGVPYYGGLLSTLALYENIGTKSRAIFQFKTNDYLNLSTLESSYLKPFFLDWNRDGAPDLVLMNTNTQQTDLKIYLNTAQASQAFQISSQPAQTVRFGNLRSEFFPSFYDFDGDGDWDVVLGKSLDALEYYQNTGSNANPIFTLTQPSFAETPLNTFDRNYAPLITDWNGDGRPDLLCTYHNLAEEPYGGRLVVIPDISLTASDTARTQTIFDQSQNTYKVIGLQDYISPAAGDLNGDGLPELILGTSGGGVILLKNTSLSSNSIWDNGIRLGPTPSKDWVYITPEQDSEISVFSLLGQQMLAPRQLKANTQLTVSVGTWAPGMYLVKVTQGTRTRSRKFIVAR